MMSRSRACSSTSISRAVKRRRRLPGIGQGDAAGSGSLADEIVQPVQPQPPPITGKMATISPSAIGDCRLCLQRVDHHYPDLVTADAEPVDDITDHRPCRILPALFLEPAIAEEGKEFDRNLHQKFQKVSISSPLKSKTTLCGGNFSV